MMQKFNDGDLVTINRNNPKLPKWIRDKVNFSRPRKIRFGSYSKTRQHTLYYLGSNKRGLELLDSYGFMPSMLIKWVNRGKCGKPREKRVYNKRQLLIEGYQVMAEEHKEFAEMVANNL